MSNQSKEKKPSKVCISFHNVEMRGILLSFISLLIVLIKGNNFLLRFFLREKISKLQRTELLNFLNELTLGIVKTGSGQQKLLKHKKKLTATNLAKLEKARFIHPEMISEYISSVSVSIEQQIDGEKVRFANDAEFLKHQYGKWLLTPMGKNALSEGFDQSEGRTIGSISMEAERFARASYELSLHAYVCQGESE